MTHIEVHLQNGKRVYFTEANLHDRIATLPTTTLTAFFRLCQTDEFAQTVLHTEVPKYYSEIHHEKNGSDVCRALLSKAGMV